MLHLVRVRCLMQVRARARDLFHPPPLPTVTRIGSGGRWPGHSGGRRLRRTEGRRGGARPSSRGAEGAEEGGDGGGGAELSQVLPRKMPQVQPQVPAFSFVVLE